MLTLAIDTSAGTSVAVLRGNEVLAEVTHNEGQKHAEQIGVTIAEAIEAGGSTLRDYAQPDGQLGYFSKQFDVYDRAGQPCRSCGTPIARHSSAIRARRQARKFDTPNE